MYVLLSKKFTERGRLVKPRVSCTSDSSLKCKTSIVIMSKRQKGTWVFVDTDLPRGSALTWTRDMSLCCYRTHRIGGRLPVTTVNLFACLISRWWATTGGRFHNIRVQQGRIYSEARHEVRILHLSNRHIRLALRVESKSASVARTR